MGTDKDGSLGSPVRLDQTTVPIADAMEAYLAQDRVAFLIPAHAGGRNVRPEFARWAGPDTARYDLPLGHGVGTRNRAWGVQSTAQELFADAVGARQTLFSTNGSSLSVRVAIMAVAGPGETIVMVRNGHKSSIAGLVLSGARPVWIDPVYDDDLELALGPTAESVAAALDAHPEARAVMVSTPSYYGTSADVAAIAGVCHERGVPLVTDDAWGLDYALSGHPDLPRGAVDRCDEVPLWDAPVTACGGGLAAAQIRRPTALVDELGVRSGSAHRTAIGSSSRGWSRSKIPGVAVSDRLDPGRFAAVRRCDARSSNVRRVGSYSTQAARKSSRSSQPRGARWELRNWLSCSVGWQHALSRAFDVERHQIERCDGAETRPAWGRRATRLETSPSRTSDTAPNRPLPSASR